MRISQVIILLLLVAIPFGMALAGEAVGDVSTIAPAMILPPPAGE
jgi:hypothetical protein